MIVPSPDGFADAVRAHPFDEFSFDAATLAGAAASVAAAGLLVVGEPHGVRETPSVLYALAVALGARAVALEWSHEELDGPLQDFLRTGEWDFERLWSLPPSAEFFCGDGRVAAGHFALLERLRREGRLDQAIAFDRLDPEPEPEDWRPRDRELAERLLAEWDGRAPLLVLTGAFHALPEADGGETMAGHLARKRPGLEAAMLDFARGRGWSRGAPYDVAGAALEAAITIRLPEATPAVVPGPPAAAFGPVAGG